MQSCDELKNIVIRHYGQFSIGGQADSIEDMYSNQEGLVIIENDLHEWFDDRESIITFMKASGSNKLDIKVHNLTALSEGTVGWTMDRVSVKLPIGVELPVRHTRIFHKENNTWKMVHLHVSIAMPNNKIGE